MARKVTRLTIPLSRIQLQLLSLAAEERKWQKGTLTLASHGKGFKFSRCRRMQNRETLLKRTLTLLSHGQGVYYSCYH
jgi:hypothetical protein